MDVSVVEEEACSVEKDLSSVCCVEYIVTDGSGEPPTSRYNQLGSRSLASHLSRQFPRSPKVRVQGLRAWCVWV